MMIIRLADLDSDGSQIFDGAKDFINRMDYAEFLPIDDMALAKCIGDVLAMEAVETIVAEQDGEIVGFIGMLYGPFLWNKELTIADELFIWSAPSAAPTTLLRMLRFIEVRMVHHGVCLKEFTELTSSPRSITKLYAAMGLRQAQTSWIGRV